MYPFFERLIQKEKDDSNPETILYNNLYPQLRDEF